MTPAEGDPKGLARFFPGEPEIRDPTHSHVAGRETAVYERGRSGLLAAARIYDDVDPPFAPG